MKHKRPAAKEPITMEEIDALAASLGISQEELTAVDPEISNLTDEEVFLLAQQVVANYRFPHALYDAKQ